VRGHFGQQRRRIDDGVGPVSLFYHKTGSLSLPFTLIAAAAMAGIAAQGNPN